MVEVYDALIMQSFYAQHKANQKGGHQKGKATDGTGSEMGNMRDV